MNIRCVIALGCGLLLVGFSGCLPTTPQEDPNSSGQDADPNVVVDNGGDKADPSADGNEPAQLRVTEPIAAHFDGEIEGWQVQGGDFPAATVPTWVEGGGSPDGWVVANGQGEWYWLAPHTFLGHLAELYGGTLKFDLNQSVPALNCIQRERLVILNGGGHEITYDAPYKPEQAWTSYTIRLDETENWYRTDTHERVTRATLLTVLGDLGQLKIRGWFSVCHCETPRAGLDSVVLAPPDTETVIVSAAGSTFAADEEQWTVAGGSFELTGPLGWRFEGGSPDGFVAASGDDAWYWLAPPQFFGDASAAYGGVLKFDVNHNQPALNCVQATRLVVLNGGGGALYYDAPYKPKTTWTSYTVRLHETELWFDEATGSRATQAQMRAALGDLSQLKIRGGFIMCGRSPQTGGLDSVELVAASEPVGPPVSAPLSTFDTDDERWTVAGGGLGMSGPVVWNADGGSPDGHVSAVGTGAWYWLAPPHFLGDASAAYGRTLQFDVYHNQSALNCVEAEGLVVLNGGGYEICCDGPYKPDTTWTNYAVRLSETEAWYHGTTRRPVTRLEMQAVLADLSQLRIRGGFVKCGGAEDLGGGLDNVALETE